MSIDTKDIQVGGETYRLTKFGATQAVKISLRVTKYLEQMVAAATKSHGEAATILSVLPHISEEDFFAVSSAFAERTVIITGDKTQILSKVFDTHFSGRGSELLEWFAACLEYQIVGFFGAALTAQTPNGGSDGDS